MWVGGSDCGGLRSDGRRRSVELLAGDLQHFDFDFDDLYWQEIKIHSKLKSKLALLCHHQYSHHQHHISKTVKLKPEQILSQCVTFT